MIFPMWSVTRVLGGPSKLYRFLDYPDDGRVLVLVQLAGGNDGINTVIPYGQDAYYVNRPKLGVDATKIINLNGEIGLHPALEKLLPLYDNGEFAIVQGVGYPNPNRSHFKSMDIWLTASDSSDVKETGWLGRYFDILFPPDENSNNSHSIGPPALQIGLTSSLALLGRNPKGIALRDPLAFYNLVARQTAPHCSDCSPESQTMAERELEFLRDTAASAFQYADELLQAWNRGSNSTVYPDDSLAAQLSVVARMISGGLTTRVYIVSIRGFDTHANQLGKHTSLLGSVANAISTFHQDLKTLGLSNRVVGMCFSEFGRRVYENASQGTDHGTAAPMFLFGQPVRGGIHGTHPSLTDLDQGDLKHTADFRQVYSSILDQWLNIDPALVLGGGFSPLPLIESPLSISEGGELPRDFYLAQNYPNPFNSTTTIQYGLPRDARIELNVFDMLGRRIATLFDGLQKRGAHKIAWSANGTASGVYVLRLTAEGISLSRKIQLVK